MKLFPLCFFNVTVFYVHLSTIFDKAHLLQLVELSYNFV